MRITIATAALGILALSVALSGHTQPPAATPKDDFAAVAQPFLKTYCLQCHSTKAKKGSLDLERFTSVAAMRKDLKPWLQTIEMLETLEMPPKEKPQPTAAERKQMIAWIRGFLDAEARARAGDPGHVPLRRLSNAEYDCTIRDLTGVDLRPTREFPADGAAGEGFTNAAEALADISPALLTKYLNAAKDIASHAVLLPDGFRFSATKTRRDWTDESLARLRAFYGEFSADGRLPLQPYLAATIRHREALRTNQATIEEIARKEKLNRHYLAVLWRTLTDKTPSLPLDTIRARWNTATEADVGALLGEIGAWQTALWKFVPIGSYRYGNVVRQLANEPSVSDTQTVKLPKTPQKQGEVVLHLVARELAGDSKGQVVWQRPRFEAAGKPALLLRDYRQFGAVFEIEPRELFADSAKYLAAVAEAAHTPRFKAEELARKHSLDVAFLKRWLEVLDVEGLAKERDPDHLGETTAAVALQLLDEKAPVNPARPAINGWRKKGIDLPIVISNASDKVELVPGRIPAHKVAAHPTPVEFVAVFWKSPVAGSVRIAARIQHAHPACGNGVAWWIEQRREQRAAILADGAVALGGVAELPARAFRVKKGDALVLAVDAKDANHVCDLTEIELSITQEDKPGLVWSLSKDVADNVLAGNPQADRHGNKDVWSFVRGPSRKVSDALIPAGSLLESWREAVADPQRQAEAGKLADQVQTLLSGPKPAQGVNRVLHDKLTAAESPLFQGVDLSRLSKPRPARFGLPADRFNPDGNLVVPIDAVTEVRLPAALLSEREFVVEGKLEGAAGDRLVQFQVRSGSDKANFRWDGKSPLVGSATGPAYQRLLKGCAEFRECFPSFVSYSRVIPDDEVVCLKMYHREDEPLTRLFLDDAQKRRLEQLWAEHRFISRQPVAENDYLPQFIGFVTQDQPKELLAYFEGQRGAFRQRAEQFLKDEEAAVPKQLAALLDFAARAYRRPLEQKEKEGLLALHQSLRAKGASGDEAFRGVLARVLVAPAFLFRIEQAPPGKAAGPISQRELATRLSYFLWSSLPDEELTRLAETGRLSDPKILAEQTRRMLRDDKVRSLAIEFGTQWIHVRGFDELKEKNEKLFPSFDANLRKAIYEESILFFQDLFQADRSVTHILDADATFLNETLAKHYGIPGVVGSQWRRVEGVKKYGRGGVLGLASVQARQSGASRTSPVLRGNWVVETLLGEKLPRPPADVPRLPEQEGGDGLTMRQLVEKHASVASCAVCHQRIDPYGFALENFDPIGRRRDKDLGGLPVDAQAKLKDGSAFTGIDGLRGYLLTKKKDVVERLFSRRLVGYALGRAVTLSDQALIDEMLTELKANEGRLSAAVLTIIRSPQFRTIRGRDFQADE